MSLWGYRRIAISKVKALNRFAGVMKRNRLTYTLIVLSVLILAAPSAYAENKNHRKHSHRTSARKIPSSLAPELRSKLRHGELGFTSFPYALTDINPCNNELVSVTGNLRVLYILNKEDKAPSHNIAASFFANGSGDKGNKYIVIAEGHEKYNAPTQDLGAMLAFDLPFRAGVISLGKAPNYTVDGTVTVYVANGQVVSASLPTVTSRQCQRLNPRK